MFKFKNNKLYKLIQGKNDRNRALFFYARDLGFDMPEIRAGMVKMLKINMSSLAKEYNIAPPTLYAALHGRRPNEKAQKILAEAVGLPVGIFFGELHLNG